MDQRQPIPEERAEIAAAQTQDRSWNHSLEAHKGKSCQLTGLVLGHSDGVMDLTLPYALSSHGNFVAAGMHDNDFNFSLAPYLETSCGAALVLRVLFRCVLS